MIYFYVATNAEHAQDDDMFPWQIYHVDRQNEQKIIDSPVKKQIFPGGVILLGKISLCSWLECLVHFTMLKPTFITKTYLYNFDPPLNPTFI